MGYFIRRLNGELVRFEDDTSQAEAIQRVRQMDGQEVNEGFVGDLGDAFSGIGGGGILESAGGLLDQAFEHGFPSDSDDDASGGSYGAPARGAGDFLIQAGREHRQREFQTLTPETARAMSRSGLGSINPFGEAGLGDTGRVLAMNAVGSLPFLAGTMGTGLALRAAGASSGAAATGAAAMEGLQGAGGVSASIEESVRDIAYSEPEVFASSEYGRRALAEAGGNFEVAVEIASERARGVAPVVAGIITGVVGRKFGVNPFGRGTAAGRTLALSILNGASRESMEEAIQSVNESLATDIDVRNIDTERPIAETAEQAATAGIIGSLSAAPLGGAFGAFDYLGGPRAAAGAPASPGATAQPPPGTPPSAPPGLPGALPGALPSPDPLDPEAEFEPPPQTDDDLLAERLDEAMRGNIAQPIDALEDPEEGAERAIEPVPVFGMSDKVRDAIDDSPAVKAMYDSLSAQGASPTTSRTFERIEALSQMPYAQNLDDSEPIGFGLRVTDTLPDGTQRSVVYEVPGAQSAEEAMAALRGAPPAPVTPPAQAAVQPSPAPVGQAPITPPIELAQPVQPEPPAAPAQAPVAPAAQPVTPAIGTDSNRHKPQPVGGRAFKQPRTVTSPISGEQTPTVQRTGNARTTGPVTRMPVDAQTAAPPAPKPKSKKAIDTELVRQRALQSEQLAGVAGIETAMQPAYERGTGKPIGYFEAAEDRTIGQLNVKAGDIVAHHEDGTIAAQDRKTFALRYKKSWTKNDQAVADMNKEGDEAQAQALARIEEQKKTQPATTEAVKPTASFNERVSAKRKELEERKAQRAAQLATAREQRAAPARAPQTAPEAKPERKPRRSNAEVRARLEELEEIEDDDAREKAVSESDLTRAELNHFKKEEPKGAYRFRETISDLLHGKKGAADRVKTAEEEEAAAQARNKAKIHARMNHWAVRIAKDHPTAASARREADKVIDAWSQQKDKALTPAQEATFKQVVTRAWAESHGAPKASLAGETEELSYESDPFGIRALNELYEEAESIPANDPRSWESITAVRRSIAKYAPRIGRHQPSLKAALNAAEELMGIWVEDYDFLLTPTQALSFKYAVARDWYRFHPAQAPPPSFARRIRSDNALENVERELQRLLAGSGLKVQLSVQNGVIAYKDSTANALYKPLENLISIALANVDPTANDEEIMRRVLPWLSEELLHAARHIGYVNDTQYRTLVKAAHTMRVTEADAEVIGARDLKVGDTFYNATEKLYRVYYDLIVDAAYEQAKGKLPDNQVVVQNWLNSLSDKQTAALQEQFEELVEEEAAAKVLQVATARLLADEEVEQPGLIRVVMRAIVKMLRALARAVRLMKPDMREQYMEHAEQFVVDLFGGAFAENPEIEAMVEEAMAEIDEDGDEWTDDDFTKASLAGPGGPASKNPNLKRQVIDAIHEIRGGKRGSGQSDDPRQIIVNPSMRDIMRMAPRDGDVIRWIRGPSGMTMISPGYFFTHDDMVKYAVQYGVDVAGYSRAFERGWSVGIFERAGDTFTNPGDAHKFDDVFPTQRARVVDDSGAEITDPAKLATAVRSEWRKRWKKPMAAFQSENSKSLTAKDLQSLERAKALAAEGVDRNEIWRLTRWAQTRNGKFVKRLDLRDLALSESFMQWMHLGKGRRKKMKLGAMLDAPRLFDAYPQLRTVDVYLSDHPDDRAFVGIDYSPVTKKERIRLGLEEAFIVRPRKGTVLDERMLRSLLAHEINHLIQDIEKLERGASVDEMIDQIKAGTDDWGILPAVYTDMARDLEPREGVPAWDRRRRAIALYLAVEGEVASREAQDALEYTDEQMELPPTLLTQETTSADKNPILASIPAGVWMKANEAAGGQPLLLTADMIADFFVDKSGTKQALSERAATKQALTPSSLARLDEMVAQRMADVDEAGFFSAVERAWNTIKSQPGFPREATLKEWINRIASANVEARPKAEELAFIFNEKKIEGALEKHDLIQDFKYSAETIEAIIRGNRLRFTVTTNRDRVRGMSSRPSDGWTARWTDEHGQGWLVYDANGDFVTKVPPEAATAAGAAIGYARRGGNMRKPGRPPGDVLYGHRLTNAEGKMASETVFQLPEDVPGGREYTDHRYLSAPHIRLGVYGDVLVDQVDGRIAGSDEALDLDLAGQIQSYMVQQEWKPFSDKERTNLAHVRQQANAEVLKEYSDEAVLAALAEENPHRIIGYSFAPPDSEAGRRFKALLDKHADAPERPNAPMQTTEQFVRSLLSAAMYQAAVNGRDGVAVPTGETVDIIQDNDKDARAGFYDTTVKNIARKMAARYGMSFHDGSVTHYGGPEEMMSLSARDAQMFAKLAVEFSDVRKAYADLGIDASSGAITRNQVTQLIRRMENNFANETGAYVLRMTDEQTQKALAYNQFRIFLRDGLDGGFSSSGSKQDASVYIMKFTPESRSKVVTRGFPLMAMSRQQTKPKYTPPGRKFGAARSRGTYSNIPAQPGYLDVYQDLIAQLGPKTAPKMLSKPLVGGVLDFADKTAEFHIRRARDSLFRNLGKLMPFVGKFAESYFPLGGLPDRIVYEAIRAVAAGRIGEGEDVAAFVASAVAKAFKVSKRDAMRMMGGNYTGIPAAVADRIELAREVMTTRRKSSLIAAARTLNDPALVAALLQARMTIIEVGHALVENKVIHQRQFDSKAGHDPSDIDSLPGGYLLRAYAETFESNVRAKAGLRASGARYRYMRQALPEAERLLKNEVKDIPALIYASIERPLRDLAAYGFWNGVMHHANQTKNGWVLPGSTIVFGGKVRSLWYLANQKAANDQSLRDKEIELARIGGAKAKGRAAVRLVREIRILQQQSQDMEAAIKTNPQYARALAEDELPQGYRQIPTDESQFGDAAGAIVMKQIWDDGTGGVDSITINSDSLGQNARRSVLALNRVTKFLYTVGNLPTHFRNLYSNIVQLTRSGTNAARVGPALIELIDYIRTGKRSRAVETAIKYGRMKQTFTEAELRALDKFARGIEAARKRAAVSEWTKKNIGPLTPLVDFATEAGLLVDAFVKAGADVASNIYQMGDVLFNIAKIEDELDRGTPPALAALEARKFFFDYSAVHPWVRWLRSYALAPFISYNYFSLPVFLDVATTAPWRIGIQYWMYFAMLGFATSLMGMDNEDAKRGLHEALERRVALGMLPWRDEHDRIQHPDIGYSLPEGGFLQAALGDFPSGDVITGLASIGFTGGPLFAMIAGARTGIDPFRQVPIWDETDDSGTRALKYTAFLGRSFLPPFINYFTPALPGEDFGGPGHEALFGTGVDRYGRPTQTGGQLVARMAGVNLYPNEFNHGRMRRMIRYQWLVSQAENDVRREYGDMRNYEGGRLTARGQAKIDLAMGRYNALVDDLVQYIDETAEVARIESERGYNSAGQSE